MSTTQIGCFLQLKKRIEETFQSRHESCTSPIEDWKGGDIRAFQSDLQESLGGYISEKWFYTHIKTMENEKLPRIDMLDMLAAYIGAENWEDFLKQTLGSVSTAEKKETIPESESARPSTKKGKHWTRTLVAAGLIGCSGLLIFFFISNFSIASTNKNFNFCFVDADTKSPIQTEVTITLLQETESALYFKSDSAGCVSISHQKNKVKIVVAAPYYRTDTIERSLIFEDYPQTIPLKKDDYALMLHYFSTQNMEDWKKRRQQLDEMIADNAQIVQIMDSDEYGETGIEMYTKKEFINKLTMPLHSLKNIDIIETVYDMGKMIQIRFKQNEE
jgi:hypothetical protein